jgi:DNA-repair protein complementing XP-A cells
MHTIHCIAKANQRQKEELAGSSSTLNVNNKRPIGVTSATSNSPTAPAKKDKPLERDKRLGTYFEYDLSKMQDSKGGFLVEDERPEDESAIRRAKERELQRLQQTLDPREL